MASSSPTGPTGPPGRVALRYMNDFQCLGTACEDSCCGGWSIGVDQGRYAKLRRLLSPGPAGALVMLPPGERTRDLFATIRLDEQGRCPLLEEDGLCSIHHRHGVDAMPLTCASYPRSLSRVGDRLELSGALSCPEVARRALLGADATDLVEADDAPALRDAALLDMRTRPGDGYARHLDEIRGTMYDFAGRTGYPLASRLFFTTCLAYRTHDLFQEGTLDQPRLEAELDQLSQAGVLEALHLRLQAHRVQLSPAVQLVTEVLSGICLHTNRLPFRHVVEAVISSYAEVPGSGLRRAGGAESDVTLEPDLLAEAYERRRTEVLGALGGRVELYLRNYCRHFWIKEFHVQSESLQQHVQGLLLRIAALRFLLLSHPAALSAARAQDGEGAAALDRLAVRVFYTFSRTIEHSQERQRDLSALAASRLHSLSAAVDLLSL